MADTAPQRTLSENGIPQPFNQAERDEASAAYNQAKTRAEQVAVLQKYPFLAGLGWKQYQPQSPAAPVTPETK